MKGVPLFGVVAGVLAAVQVAAADIETLNTSIAGADFGKGSRFSGASAGIGRGTMAFGGYERHHASFLNIHYGSVITDGFFPGTWYEGHIHLIGEGGVGYQHDPRSATILSATPMLRYVFMRGNSRWLPYLTGGIGLVWTDIGLPDLGGKFQFGTQGGAGILYHVQPNLVATFEYRLVHYSNAGLRRSNAGVNLHTALVGLSWLH